MISLSAIATLALAMMGDDDYDPDLLDLLGERCYPEGEDTLVGSKVDAQKLTMFDYEQCLGKLARVHLVKWDNSYGEPQYAHVPEGVEVKVMPTGQSLLFHMNRDSELCVYNTIWRVKLAPSSIELGRKLGIIPLESQTWLRPKKLWIEPRGYMWDCDRWYP